jgi:hypothetical protein
MTDFKKIKEELFDHCLKYTQLRISNIQNAIESARESGNDENKSSAGDKHETGRSMAQLAQENLSHQLLESEKLLQLLGSVERGKTSPAISIGSLVITDHGNYFISISAGKLIVEEETYYAVSPASPIGSALLNAKGLSEFKFNGKNYRIKTTI